MKGAGANGPQSRCTDPVDWACARRIINLSISSVLADDDIRALFSWDGFGPEWHKGTPG